MKKTSDVTIEILKDIRGELKDLRGEVHGTNERLDTGLAALGGRIDETNRRLVETEIRLSTELVAVSGAIHELTTEFRRDRDLRVRVDQHEQRIEALEGRVGAR